MPVPGAPWDDVLLPDLETARGALPDGATVFDAHTHTGQDDPDGVTATAGELLEGMDRAGIARALVFTTAEPGGYPPANDRVRDEVAAAGGRLEWLARIDPNAGDPLPEARRCLEAGARGFKLHPRSDAFVLSHPSVQAVVGLAGEAGAVVLVHAGRGIPALGPDLVALAGAHPGARFILAHAGISDLGLVADAAQRLPNVFFDTSWWNVADLLTLYTEVAPARILFASDMPYGGGRFALLCMLRCAREAGLGEDAIRWIAGAGIAAVLAGDPVPDLGPAPGRDALGPRRAALERVVTHSASSVQIAFRGGDATEPLALARSACQIPDGAAPSEQGALLARVDELLGAAEAASTALPDDPEVAEVRNAAMPALVAHLLAGTPRVPV